MTFHSLLRGLSIQVPSPPASPSADEAMGTLESQGPWKGSGLESRHYAPWPVSHWTTVSPASSLSQGGGEACAILLSYPTHSSSLEKQHLEGWPVGCRTQVGVGEEEEELLGSLCHLCPGLGHTWPPGAPPQCSQNALPLYHSFLHRLPVF